MGFEPPPVSLFTKRKQYGFLSTRPQLIVLSFLVILPLLNTAFSLRI